MFLMILHLNWISKLGTGHACYYYKKGVNNIIAKHFRFYLSIAQL
jgi:hypothetical protein